jgi:solute carrier family 35 protein E2
LKLLISLFYSVANTAKRAFLIWLSVVMFGNQVTVLSAVGTITVIAGVFMYIKAQEYDDRLSSVNLIQRKVRAI